MSIRVILSSILLLGSCCACYRMPTDDDFSVVPTTNNRDVAREKSQSPAPQMGY